GCPVAPGDCSSPCLKHRSRRQGAFQSCGEAVGAVSACRSSQKTKTSERPLEPERRWTRSLQASKLCPARHFPHRGANPPLNGSPLSSSCPRPALATPASRALLAEAGHRARRYILAELRLVRSEPQR